MVDFNFDLKGLFPQRIIKVRSDLLPNTFNGNRYQVADTKSKVCQIINDLGELSALAQKLNQPITTYQKLSHKDDQTIYLLADTNVKPRGVAVGLLKVGHKDLFVHDETGQLRQVLASPCILDFYVHEKFQRSGYGKLLFDTMLHEQKWDPIKCSIDRPSEKMVGFMKKHYGLERVIPQSNHYVLFEGYFNNAGSGGGGGGGNTEFNSLQNMKPCSIEYAARSVAHLPTFNGLTHTVPEVAIVKRFETHCPVNNLNETMRKYDDPSKN